MTHHRFWQHFWLYSAVWQRLRANQLGKRPSFDEAKAYLLEALAVEMNMTFSAIRVSTTPTKNSDSR